MITFRGNVAGVYAAPVDPKTPAQIEVRNLFRDVTKTLARAGLWPKQAWRVLFGSRWYTVIYKRLTENGYSRLSGFVDSWNNMLEADQLIWEAVAPFQESSTNAGFIFYAVLSVIYEWLAVAGLWLYEMPEPLDSNAAECREWFDRSLDGVIGKGTREQGDSAFVYVGTWNTIDNGLAHGGSYTETGSASDSSVSFYCYGTQIGIFYKKHPTGGLMQIASHALGVQVVDLHATTDAWQQIWLSAGMIKGLHYVTIKRTGSGAINLDALSVIAGKIKTPTVEAVENFFAIPGASLSMTVKQDMPTDLWQGKWQVLYWTLEEWDTGGMHRSDLHPERVTCILDGVYACRVAIRMTAINVTTSMTVQLRKNGVAVAQASDRSISGTPTYLTVEVNKQVSMVKDDYLEVYLTYGTSVPVSVDVISGLYPSFEVQLMQRTSLVVDKVDMTIQNGVTRHGLLEELLSDHHTQYLTVDRGDVRYSLLGHDHAGVYAPASHTHQSSDVLGGHALLASIPAGGTQYMVPFIAGISVSTNGFPWPKAATMRSLYIATNSTQPASGSLVITLMKNLNATALTITVPAGGVANAYVDLTHTVAWVAGDLVTWRIVNNATSGSATIKGVSMLADMVTG